MGSGKSKEPVKLHLRALAYRIKLIMVWAVLGFAVAYYFKEFVLDILVQPLAPALKGQPKLHFTSPVEPFFTYLSLSIKAGLFLAMPAILYNIWSFIAPGLYKKEKNLTMYVTVFGALFFIIGVLFAYYIVFPYGFKFLISFAENSPGKFQLMNVLNNVVYESFGVSPGFDAGAIKVSLEPTIMMGDYLKLIINLLLAFGIVFELPLIIYFLAILDIVSPLGLMKFFRYFMVIAFALSAFLTPPDVVTQIMMALPLLAMYLLSTLVAWIVIRKRKQKK